ncbi:GNAT family N-acetyltransferase [Salipiger abyssi]|uniref:Acetyltransferase, ribosomal protein N-acetylase n=1 Tax=Salipiger abyssi TaxID=1250539 RepID=A0A1P8UP99_9RHOB|nr:GNAT family protein [Salipiger abyssi]APZ51201.1 acetyltransferase, ribosomal protein N-acetylase [Salipiger abyssi]
MAVLTGAEDGDLRRDLACLPLATERLSLRRFRPDDLPAFAAYHSRAEVYRYLYQEIPEGDAMAEKFAGFLDTPFAAEGDRLRLAVTRRADAALLGQVSLSIASLAALQGEVGYIFNPDFAGRGYATEAVRAILDLGFGQMGFHRIFARLDPLNAGSVGVVERLGLRREAHLVQNDRFNGVWGDELIYALLRTEWPRRDAPGA